MTDSRWTTAGDEPSDPPWRWGDAPQRLSEDTSRVLAHLRGRTRSHPTVGATGMHGMTAGRWRECIAELEIAGYHIDRFTTAPADSATNDVGYVLRSGQMVQDLVTGEWITIGDGVPQPPAAEAMADTPPQPAQELSSWQDTRASERDDPPRLSERQATTATAAVAGAGEPHARRYAEHLLARYDTIRRLPTVHDQRAADPDRVHNVVEEMRQLAHDQRDIVVNARLNEAGDAHDTDGMCSGDG